MDTLIEVLADVPAPNTSPAVDPYPGARRIAEVAALHAGCISGSAAMVPGPLGLASIVPEMLLVLRIQRQMVADIAGLYGEVVDLSTQVMVYCLFRHTAAQLLRDVVVRTGEKWLVRRTTARALVALLKKVGVKLTQRAFGRGVSRFLPLAGAGAMALYARWDTRRVGATAIELFAHGIAFDDREMPENL